MAVSDSAKQLDQFLDRYTPEIAAATRRALRELRRRVPGATELVHDNYNALGVGFGPSERGGDLLFSIVAYPRWVTLFFLQGAGLTDPAKLLQGTGSRVRHIVLATPQVITSPDVEALIAQALKRAKVPIDPKARRSLVIRSVSARQRPRRPTGATRPVRKAGVDVATLTQLALALPGVTDTSASRGVSFKVHGKLLACKAIHRSAEPQTLMVRIAVPERDRLIAKDPAQYYLTPHYVNTACVLVRLSVMRQKALKDLLQQAWQFVTGAARVRKKAKRKRAVSVFEYL